MKLTGRTHVAIQVPRPNPLEAILVQIAPVGSIFFVPLQAETQMLQRH